MSFVSLEAFEKSCDPIWSLFRPHMGHLPQTACFGSPICLESGVLFAGLVRIYHYALHVVNKKLNHQISNILNISLSLNFEASILCCASGHSCTTAKAKAYSTAASLLPNGKTMRGLSILRISYRIFWSFYQKRNRIITTWDGFESQAVWLPDVPAFQQEITRQTTSFLEKVDYQDCREHERRKRCKMNASECSLSCKHMKDFYTPGPEIGKKLASAGRSERKLTNIRTKRFDLCVFEISKQLSVRCQIVSNCLGMKL